MCEYTSSYNNAEPFEIKPHVVEEFDREVGLEYLRGMHLNDSKADLGSKKDRHENIGLGHLTLSTFANIVRDPRTRHIPLILETPAFDGPGSKLAQGMDIWKKEVEILNRLSRQDDADAGVDDEKLEVWTEEIRNVVREASEGKDAKVGKETKGKGPGKKRSGGDVKGKGKETTVVKGKKKAKKDCESDSSGLSSMSDDE
ncbi:hypothetical protein QCA50_003703 [Cerrena zonata]|uniref:Xylose isomerase-like TIM barrel domain-containing protein n=1 Tax=Cerrena zonata TaxID=2478898 RepID=A0AAW0GQE1_9APHY